MNHENKINEESMKQNGALAGLQNGAALVNAKCLGMRQGAKNLVEFLLARKQMQIAAHKHSARLKHS